MNATEISNHINFLQHAWDSVHADLREAMVKARRTPIARPRCVWLEQQLRELASSISDLRRLAHDLPTAAN